MKKSKSTAKDSQALKQLKTRQAKLEVEVKESAADSKVAQKTWLKKVKQLKNVGQQIKDLSKSEPVVTEHALLRYAERVMGLDLDEVKAQILKPETVAQIKALGNGSYPIGNGRQAVVKDMSVVSIV